MDLKKLTRLAGSLAASLVISTAASAGVVWQEQAPGAGDLTTTAQVTADSAQGPLTGITGALRSVVPVGNSGNPATFEIDVYQIRIDPTLGFFSARTVSSTPDDTSLFLFDSMGLGVYMNDDNGVDLLSALPDRDLLAGVYYIAVALGGTEAYSDLIGVVSSFIGGAFDAVREGDPTAGPLQSWGTQFAAGTEPDFGYSIELTGARVAVPEPATLALVLFMAIGLVAKRHAAARRP